MTKEKRMNREPKEHNFLGALMIVGCIGLAVFVMVLF